jgi:hypothetical protein
MALITRAELAPIRNTGAMLEKFNPAGVHEPPGYTHVTITAAGWPTWRASARSTSPAPSSASTTTRRRPTRSSPTA